MKRILALLLLAAVLSGCAVGAPDVQLPEEGGRLTVYTCLDETVYAPLILEFESRTGIWTEVETGTAPGLLSRCGDGRCDVLLGCEMDLLAASGEAFLSLAGTGASLDPMCPPSDTFAPVSLRSLVLIYNSRLIRQNPPTGLRSLLEKAWQGQIAFADPEVSDFSRTALAVLRTELGDEAIEAFAGNLSRLLPDTQSVVEAVAEGSFCLALAPEDAALRAMAEGAALTVVYPSEGVFRIAQAAAVPAAAPHPDNAAELIAFLQGEDAQRYNLDKSGLDPVPEDLGRRVERERFFDAAAAGQEQPSLMALWQAGWEERP